MKTRLLLGLCLSLFLHLSLSAQCISGNCQNGIGILLMDNGERYVGHFSQGQMEGLGSWYYTDGSRYTGNWKAGKRHGEGTLHRPKAEDESGYWSDGLLQNPKKSKVEKLVDRGSASMEDGKTGCISGDCQEGTGTYILADGSVYVGEFEQGEIHGVGVCYYRDGSRYRGEWAHRLPHGKGTRYYPNGQKRTGNWQQGIAIGPDGRFESLASQEKYVANNIQLQTGCILGNCQNGTGSYAYPDGSRYEGSFRAGKPDGEGVFHYPNGDRYEGQLLRGLRHGTGKLYHQNGTVSYGPWSQGDPISNMAASGQQRTGCIEGDCRNGYGIYIFKDNAKYLGDFRNGQPHGQGIVEYTNGEKYEGEMRDGAFAGRGTLYMTDGNELVGYWDKGAYLGRQMPYNINIPTSRPATQDYVQTVPARHNGPKIWAVIIGVSSYNHMPVLRYPDDDAYRIFAFLKSPEGGAIPDEQIRILVDEDATRQQIVSTMQKLFSKAGKDDLVFLYFSGHGLPGAFLPIDYDGMNNQLFHDEISGLLARTQAKYKLCIADACHSGSLLAMKGRDPQALSLYYENLARAQAGTALIMSSKSDETSLESSGLRQGVFSHFLIRGLKGEADLNLDKKVGVQELYDFVYNHVRTYTGNRQSPVIQGDYDPSMLVSVIR